MTLCESIDVLTKDLVGIKCDDFHSAFLIVAFADQEALADTGFNPQAMRETLAAIIAKHTGATAKVVLAAIHSPLDVRSIMAKNCIVPKEFLNSFLSRHKKPLDNYTLAAAILAYGPDSPRFGDAMAYVIEEGEDVPEEIRANVAQAFKEAAIEENLPAAQIAAFE